MIVPARRPHLLRHAFFLGAAFGMVAAASPVRAATPDLTLGRPTSVAGIARIPANVPRDYVVTPDGFFHPSCVQSVAPGETVRADGTIARRDGSTKSVAPCVHVHYAADGTALAPNAAPLPPTAAPSEPADIEGWVVYASYSVPEANAATRLAADMSVPSAPVTQSGQVVYFFPGLEDGQNVETILQPVLGWNAFNDDGWTIASWNCCMNGHVWHSSAVRVDSGDTLYGLISSSSCSGNVCDDWSVLTRDLDSGRDTTLDTSSYGQAFSWIFGAVLEAYGITDCGNLPENGTAEFSRIAVHTLTAPIAGTMQLPAWQQTVLPNTPDCGYSASPHPKANSPQITLGY